MKKVKGDLIQLAKDGKFDVIVHGCNCFHSMDGGIARSIKNEFPRAFEADQNTKKGDQDKMGTYSKAEIEMGDTKFTVINAYTQLRPGYVPDFDYDVIRDVFRQIKHNFSGKRIGYPAIGSGIAGGDWKKIAAAIEEELRGKDHTFVEFSG